MVSNNAHTEPPRVSLIIPTHNRRDELAELLSCLEKQTLPRNQFEIIVVDDGSDDDTLTCLKNLVNKGKNNLYFFYQKNMGPGAARNQAMLMARAPVFAFTDTDCRPFPSWLEELLRMFSEKDVGAVGGAEEIQAGDSALMHAIHFCMTSSFTTGGMRGKKGRKLARYYPRTFNMAISRKAFRETGGFKPLYHGEDIELSFRIKKAGFNICYNEDAKVYHKRRCSIKQFFFQVLAMGEARVTLASLHPEMLETLHVLPAAAVLTLTLFLILSFFSSLFLILFKALLITGACFIALIEYCTFRQKRGFRMMVLVPLVFIVQQSAYGMGFLRGICKKFICPRFCRQ